MAAVFTVLFIKSYGEIFLVKYCVTFLLKLSHTYTNLYRYVHFSSLQLLKRNVNVRLSDCELKIITCAGFNISHLLSFVVDLLLSHKQFLDLDI